VQQHGPASVVCRNFDKDHIDPAVMKKIQTYTPQADFQPEKIEKVWLVCAVLDRA
jgi:hypothetical protein